VRVLDDLLASGLAIRVATVPAPHDPDSFIKAHGGPAFRQLIDQAEGFFDFYLNLLCASHDPATDKGRLAIVKAMGEAVGKTGHAVLVDNYAQKTALRLAVTAEAVRAEFNQIAKSTTASAPGQAAEMPAVDSLPRPSPQEFWLLKLLFLEETDMEWVARRLDLNWLQHPSVLQIVSLRLAAHNDKRWHGVAALLSELPDAIAQSLLTEALSDRRPIPNPAQQLSDLLVRLRNQSLDRQIVLTHQRAGQPNLSDAERGQLLQQLQTLRAQKKAPLDSTA
jgi:DNA primase